MNLVLSLILSLFSFFNQIRSTRVPGKHKSLHLTKEFSVEKNIKYYSIMQLTFKSYVSWM